MAATGKVYGLHAKDQYGATAADRIDWVNDDVRMSLHTSSYTPNQDTHDYYDDLTNELAASGGYSSGGVALTGKTLTYDGASNTVRLKADAVTYSSLTPSGAIRYAVARKHNASASAAHLIFYVDMGADQSPSGIDFTVQGDSTDGFVKVVVS